MKPLEMATNDRPFIPATEKQLAVLRKHGMLADHQIIDRHTAWSKIKELVRLERESRPTERQEYTLKENGLWREGMSRGEAWDIINGMYQPDYFS